MKIISNFRFFTFAVIFFIAVPFCFGQEKKPLTLDDYAQWNSINNVSLSPDGNVITYAYNPNEGDATFYVRQLDADTLRTAINGKQADFSEDSKWLAFLTDPEKEVAEKLKSSKEPVLSDLHIVNLQTNTASHINSVKQFSFSKSSNFIAILKHSADKKAEHKGSDLLLKHLVTNSTLNIGNVSDFAFNEAGTLLSYTVDADDDNGNGLYLLDLSNMRTWPLHSGEFTYTQMTWNPKQNQMAVLFGNKEDNQIEFQNTLYWTSNLAPGMTTAPVQNTYVPQNDANFPKHMVISEYGNLTWNEAGTQLFLGIKEQQTELKKEDELKANVDVWHWKDERLQSRQMVQAKRDLKATYKSVLNLNSKTFIQLEDDDMTSVEVSKTNQWAVGGIDTLYRSNLKIVSGYEDMYSINTKTGAKRLIANKVFRYLGMSPDGNWTLFAKDKDIMGYHFESGKVSNLTTATGLSFRDVEFDKVAEKPTYGVAGWSKDGQTLMLNHQYDVWSVALYADAVSNLTQGLGTQERIRFRLVQLDPEAKTFDLTKPLLLSAYGDTTKKSGYYQLEVGQTPKALLYEDKMIRRLTKAKQADKVIFTQESFVDFPDYWWSDLSFKKPKQITNANPQQANYKWGKRVLIDYTDARGNQLQATLALPAGYTPGKTYPMIVYFYEKLSQRHHQYSMPTYDDRPHMSTYASNGYLVLMPDIVYDAGLPGSSALDDVTSATKEVIKQGYADPERIGLQGHSWGGYESSFIVTQTDMFATVVTGAPLTNLISMYNILYKRSGGLNGPILEWSQGRMGVSPWEDMDLYISQSPLHQAPNIKTPFLILHGTADGAVDWNQGLEFYTAARRLGKEVILLSYPDEPHHLRNEDNQKDFQMRMKQYFDHYLKDAPAPLWMTKGIDHLDKKRIGPEVMENGN